MNTRDSFCADWAFGIRGAIENFVRRAYPSELRRWPLLQTFDFDGFAAGDSHFVIIMREKLGGIVAGPGVPKPFPHSDHPSLPPTPANVDEWLSYLHRRFKLRSDDIAMILPIHDSRRPDPRADFALFTDGERNLWNHQLNVGISRQVAGMNVSPQSSPPPHVTYNVSGANARVYIGSTDVSVNITTGVEPELFAEMLATIRATVVDTSGRAAVEQAVEALRRDYGKSTFADSYQAFMSVLADHIQVWAPILAPYLPGLAMLIGRP
jgi:hypothetical protein